MEEGNHDKEQLIILDKAINSNESEYCDKYENKREIKVDFTRNKIKTTNTANVANELRVFDRIIEKQYDSYNGYIFAILSIILYPVFIGVFLWKGLIIVGINESCIITLFGEYKGTLNTPGLHWINPLSEVRKVSLKRNVFESPILKVNDKNGNPINISVVIVWKVVNSSQAVFNVQDYFYYIRLQSEGALRETATTFAYDHSGNEDEITLLQGAALVNKHLEHELNSRLETAGIKVIEARITHLKYSNEIALSMLKRQQAEATIAAKNRIVHGAVTIVSGCLQALEKDIKFSDNYKSSLASNLVALMSIENNDNYKESVHVKS